MSEAGTGSGILSREEVEALVQALQESRESEERSRRRALLQADPSAGVVPRGGRYASVRRCLEEFAEEQTRHLSTAHQTPIRFAVLSSDETTLQDLAGTLLPLDRLITLQIRPGGERGFLVPGRPLTFAWLCLAFGSRPTAPRLPPPTRPYTRIEERFLGRTAADVARQLALSLGSRFPVELAVVGLEEPSCLLEHGDGEVLVASLDVSGLGDLCRLRIVLPAAPFREADAAPAPTDPSRRVGLEQAVLDTWVDLQAEVGHAELPLTHLAHLQVGDVIPIERADPAGLVVRVEGRPKFRGVRGRRGKRLAIQLIERL